MNNKTVILEKGDTLTIVDGDTHYRPTVIVLSVFENDINIESAQGYEVIHTQSMTDL